MIVNDTTSTVRPERAIIIPIVPRQTKGRFEGGIRTGDVARDPLPHNPWDLLENNAIFIGQSLAEQMHLKVGDKITLLYPELTRDQKIALEEKEVTIAALFKTGIHDFDEHVIITSFTVAQQLCDVPVTQVSLSLFNPQQEKTVIASLKQRLSLDVQSWKDLYPSLVSALILEKYAMFFVLALVILIASLNSISLIFMYMAHKRTDIAILRAMGMSNGSLMSIFIILSTLITLGATLCGISLAALITLLLNRYPFIKLPDVYYVAHLPATLDSTIIFAVFTLALFVSILAALLPARKIQRLQITNIFKSIA